MNQISTVLKLLIFLLSLTVAKNFAFSQVIYSHDFSNRTGFTNSIGSTWCDFTTCDIGDNAFGIISDPSCVSGFSGSAFYFRDIDNSCVGVTSITLNFPVIPISTSDLLTFSSKFGFDNSAIAFSGTNSATIEYSFVSAAGPWTAGTSLSSTGTSTVACSNCGIAGDLTPDAANTVTFSLGNNHNGTNLYLRLNISGFGGGTENLFMDDVAIYTPCTPPASVVLSGYASSVFSGNSPGTFTATATGGSPTTYSYLWYKDGVSTGATSQTYNPGPLTANTTIYCAVSTGYSCSTNSSTQTIIVNKTWYIDNNSNTGDIYTVGSASGNDGASGAKLTPFATLSKALSVVQAGDSILIDAGTFYDKDYSLPVTNLKIIGAGIKLTIFDNGGNSDHYFMRINKNNTTLANMTLKYFAAQTCGADENGQALGIVGATGVNIINVLVDQASTSSTGCGYPIEVRAGASVVFQGGGATCNNWFAGGGIRVSGGTTSATISNYLFYGNRKDLDDGSSLHVDDGSVVVRNSKFDSNESRSDKQGAGIFQQGGNVTVYDSWFDNNETWLANDQPGGTILISGGTFTVKRSKFTNHTQMGGSTSYGSGIGITTGTVTIDSCYFSSNSGSASRGTDVYNDGGTVTVRNSTFLSASNQIGNASGTMTVSNSGTPSAGYTTGLTFVNNNAPTYTANPWVPQFTGVCGSITILPIELMNFEGACEFTHTHLWWSTASEHNNDHFTIDRAGENGQFYELATVNGNMNTTQKTDYSFADYYAEPGVNYYRLSQADVDGKERILKTITVENNCLTGSGLDISCWYDGQNNSVEIGYLFEHRQILEAQVVNMMGQVVSSTQLVLDPHDRKAEMKLNDTFSNGMYFLRLSNDSIQFSEKFMIGKQ